MIAPSANATFVTMELGLPEGFAIVRPGLRSHVLAGAGMVCIEGVECDVW